MPDSKQPSKAPAELKSSSSPRAKEFDFEPEYAVEGGVEHTFNGTLYVPTDAEFERIDRLNLIKDGCKAMVASVQFNESPKVQRMVPHCHGYSNQDSPPPRMKMSAGELIRLAATKSKGH